MLSERGNFNISANFLCLNEREFVSLKEHLFLLDRNLLDELDFEADENVDNNEPNNDDSEENELNSDENYELMLKKTDVDYDNNFVSYEDDD